ncbi:hypothetical protein F4821DRAFT_242970 [Hypoxylon rubiginosum]|uniref:Uncharacterized protein n=1 Tax=Hypoxylon rubiginosum TaxID=110542 RepID=A0ACC0CV28_9PEZI|nr:hypothetical protein F4821DRAFT_242970 [Hypoxylon rubiginosum]
MDAWDLFFWVCHLALATSCTFIIFSLSMIPPESLVSSDMFKPNHQGFLYSLGCGVLLGMVLD